jgi:Hint domain-containing protein
VHPGVIASMNLRIVCIATLALVATACTPGGGGPTPGPTLNASELRMQLLDRFGPLWHCDQDEYPVGRDETEGMRERWPQVIADAELLAVILDRLDLSSTEPSDLSDTQRLDVYRLWKVAVAISLESTGNDRYRFDYLAQPVGGAAEGTRTAGIIAASGEISIEQQAPAGEPICPICLARGTLIDTPAGAVPVEQLSLGDPVWTLTADGRRVAGVVIALGSTAAPADHEVVRLILEDGRTVTASPGHPLADGRLIGDLRPGDMVDGSRVAAADRQPYASSETFDLVSSGDTGSYFAGGIPLGSTLLPR